MDVNNKSDEKNNDLKVVLETPNSIVVGEEEESDGEDESKSLLHPQKSVVELPRKLEKPKRKVQWLDRNGDKLAQILEFQPSDDSDDSDDDESDTCICVIM